MGMLPAIFTNLGAAIVWNVLQGSIVWLLFMLFKILFPNKVAMHYNVAIMAIAGVFILFIFSFIHYLSIADPVANQQLILSVFIVESLNGVTQATNKPIFYYVFNAIAGIYMVWLVVQLIRWPLIFRQHKNLLANTLQPLPEEFIKFIETKKQWLHLKKSIRLFIISGIKSPMTIGFFKPFILLPIAGITHLSTTAVEAILLHELAHIKRNDYLINILVQLLQSIIWFNPFARLLVKEMERSREICCDEYVLQQKYEPLLYAETLLQLARISQNYSLPVLSMPAVQHKGELLFRIKHILYANKRAVYSGRLVFRWLSVLVFMMAGFVFVYTMQLTQPLVVLHPNEMVQQNQLFIHTVADKNSILQPFKISMEPVHRTYKKQKIKLHSDKKMIAVSKSATSYLPKVTVPVSNLIIDQSLPVVQTENKAASTLPEGTSFIQTKNLFSTNSNQQNSAKIYFNLFRLTTSQSILKLFAADDINQHALKFFASIQHQRHLIKTTALKWWMKALLYQMQQQQIELQSIHQFIPVMAHQYISNENACILNISACQVFLVQVQKSNWCKEFEPGYFMLLIMNPANNEMPEEDYVYWFSNQSDGFEEPLPIMNDTACDVVSFN